jgi:hypothetical protein
VSRPRKPAHLRKTKPGEPLKLWPVEVFKPLDPDKPLAPYRVPPLKRYDRDMPGQGRLDFSQDGPVVVYDDEEDQ